MKLNIPKKLALAGGLLIAISGVINAILGLRIGAMFYSVYPGGKMGHVGVLAGLGAAVIGLLIIFFVVPFYRWQKRIPILLAGVFTIVLGHIGAVWGALYVGTVGLLLCYISGFWALVAGVVGIKRKRN